MRALILHQSPAHSQRRSPVPTGSKRAPRTRPSTTFQPNTPDAIPRRALGTTGEYVSAIGLGGYHLGLVGNEREAIRIVHAAIDAGVTFMDNAWDYHDGKSEERLGKALVGRRGDVF